MEDKETELLKEKFNNILILITLASIYPEMHKIIGICGRKWEKL